MQFTILYCEPCRYRERADDRPFVIETPAGAERHEVVFDGAEQAFAFTVAGKPLAVHVDPDFEMLRRLLPGESAPHEAVLTRGRRLGATLATQIQHAEIGGW